jgi:cytochrome d ubiquinol oxidase subunit I
MTVASAALELARWQFALTTLFHFIFVPLTLGLAPLLAVMQTLWYRTRDEKWLRLTRFFGTLFLINFAIGVATGLLQEFQFGMNWSGFSSYVGDVFGAPLAMEGLAAFFLEATFIGLWIFGWDRLSPRVHLATIYLVWLGTWLSAFFILAANSWMQHPVGYEINSQRVPRPRRRLLAPATSPERRSLPERGEARDRRRLSGVGGPAHLRQ